MNHTLSNAMLPRFSKRTVSSFKFYEGFRFTIN